MCPRITERPAGIPLTPAAPLALPEAQAALAAEWRAAAPRTSEAIAAFYRTSQCQAADQAAWHATPTRQRWQALLIHVAEQAQPATVLDIGCGAGYDLAALRPVLPTAVLLGVEPNLHQRRLAQEAVPDGEFLASIETAPLEDAALLICVDVLEHIPNPEAFLDQIAQRAPVGCWLFETTATTDWTNPLHLRSNQGWHPGRALDRHGWIVEDYSEGVRVWRRRERVPPARSSVLVCAYRGLAAQTVEAIDALRIASDGTWRRRIKWGDAVISRSRGSMLSQWWRESNDDVALMVDDDIVFEPAGAEGLVALCRAGYDIVCGAYPVGNGEHLALRCLDGTGELQFGPDQPPIEIRYAATGFMAVHRRVVDAMVAATHPDGSPRFPLCHANQNWAFWPLFDTCVIEDESAGGYSYLSEDYFFCEIARQLGFRVWLDPRAYLQHIKPIEVSVRNMGTVYQATQRV